MKILSVDTALGACSVAVTDEGAVLAHHFEIMERGHAEALAPLVETMMAEAQVSFENLERLAVTTGPGTFTGQRVGLAFMRGLRLALKIPLIGVTTLEAMAAATRAPAAAAIHDARRGEAYLLLRRDGEVRLEPELIGFEEAVKKIAAFGPCALAGTGAAQAAASLGPDFTQTDITQPDALWVARLARHRAAPATPPGPLYLRPADAKLPAAP